MPYMLLEGTPTPTAMEAIINAMGDAFSLVGKVIEQITSQPVLLFFLAASLIPVGIAIFRKLKRAAK